MVLLSILGWFLGIVLVIALSLHFAYIKLRVGYHWDRTVRMDDSGSYFRYYFCAIMQSFYRKSGEFVPYRKGELKPVSINEAQTDDKPKTLAIFHPDLSEETMYVIDCYSKHDKLHFYRRAIEFSGTPNRLPPVAMASYFNKALIALGSSEFARSRILGAVHTKQQVSVYRDLQPLLSNNFKMTAYASEYRVTERGVEADITTRVLGKDDSLFWQGIVTGVSLKGNRPKQNRKPRNSSSTSSQEFVVYREEEIKTDMDTGIKFAIASEDYQPQHLYTWTAKMVGFQKPIAHGLWTMAVAVDRIMNNEICYHDAYPLNIDTDFKRPLVLGNSALLQYEKPEGREFLSNFRVVKPTSLEPILLGRIYVGSKNSSSGPDGTTEYPGETDGGKCKDE